MNARIGELQDTLSVRLMNLVSINERSKIQENNEETAISNYTKENKIITYMQQIIKRTIDIIAGMIGTIIIIPLTILIFIAHKLSKDDGPIFYSQERIGKNGKTFKMLKYRSMVIDADEQLEKYLEENEDAREEFKKYKKLQNDPRVTKLGKFLRKTSLDELPQLLHLLTGKMSLVGPRPYLPKEQEEMGEYYNIITKSTPGLTRTMASKWKVKHNI